MYYTSHTQKQTLWFLIWIHSYFIIYRQYTHSNVSVSVYILLKHFISVTYLLVARHQKRAADHTFLQRCADERLCMHSTSNLEQQKTTAAPILTANNMKVCIWWAQTHWNWTVEDWKTPGRVTLRLWCTIGLEFSVNNINPCIHPCLNRSDFW